MHAYTIQEVQTIPMALVDVAVHHLNKVSVLKNDVGCGSNVWPAEDNTLSIPFETAAI